MRAVTAVFVSVLSVALPQVQSALVYNDTPPQYPGDLIWFDASPSDVGVGLTFTPDEEIIIQTSRDGVLVGYDPAHVWEVGELKFNKFFEFDPAAVMENVTNATCKSSVSFPGSNETYLVYAITAFYSNDNKNYGVVVAVDYSKTNATMRWHTAFGDLGAVEGTPKASSTGTEVYLTHNNENESVGTFTVLDASNDGAILYSEPNAKNDTSAYGELGIYHKPDEGWYDGGQGNTNDIVIWSNKLTENGAGGMNPLLGGGTWAFQLPADGSRNATDFVVTQLGKPTWKTSTAPIIFFRGRGLCFAVSRSALRCWYPGNPDDPNSGGDKNYFSAKATGKADLPDKDPNQGYLEPRGIPVVGGDDTKVYSGGAYNSFYGFDIKANATNQLVQLFKHNDTVVDKPIWASARLGADEKRIFYMTESGKIVCADPVNGHIYWEYFPQLLSPKANAQFTLSPDGTQLISSATYAGNLLSAIKIATLASETPSQQPSSEPSQEPSRSKTPSQQPSSEPSQEPSRSETPSQQPSSEPSQEPSRMPSDMPSSTDMLSSMPSSNPSSAPSSMPSKKPTAPTSSAPRTEQFGLLSMVLAMVVGVFVLPLH